jgi:hypothetical protein
MVRSFQEKIMISFKGCAFLQVGHLTLIKQRARMAAKIKPVIIPKNRMSKRIVSMIFIEILSFVLLFFSLFRFFHGF